MRISDWSSDVCSSDLIRTENGVQFGDLPEFVDPDYTAQVTRVNAVALATLALAPAAPANTRVRVAQLENDTQLLWAANREPDLAGYRIVRSEERRVGQECVRTGRTGGGA